MISLTLTLDTVGPVRRGHPWVYTSGLQAPLDLPPAGTPVRLLDGRGKPIGFGLSDEGPIAVRVLERHPEDIWELVHRRIQSAADLRPRILPAQTDAYRLVNAAGDGLPGLVIDRYGPVAVVRIYGACWLPHLDAIVAATSQLPGVQTVLRRLGVRRVDQGKGTERLHGPDPAEPLIVSEGGVRFLARPSTGQKTGLFLDQRDNRIQIARAARGQTVVNLFGYTGGFSVHAAVLGASRVITVDQSDPALADAEENFRLNGLDPAKHGFASADVFQWTPDEPADIVISDPPSLTRSAKSDDPARGAYRDLAQRTGAMVRPGGLLATASCTARLSWERWEEAVREGMAKSGRWSWLWRAAEPGDHPVAMGHPEGRYLKFAVARRQPPRFGD
jgi:23S rRNA (cytosine1962-C5)-methyltransferase